MSQRAHWRVWWIALCAVVTAHAMVATALVVSWHDQGEAAATAPLTLTLALETTSNAERSQVAVEAPPKPIVKKEKPMKAEIAEKYLPKPQPEKIEEPLIPQQQMAHLDAKLADQTQARHSGGSEQQTQARQNWFGQVLALLQKQKRYPRLALLRNEQGTAKVKFELDREGHLLHADLTDSSGHVALDKEALALVQRVGAFPPPPASVEGGRVSLEVPIAFQVNEG